MSGVDAESQFIAWLECLAEHVIPNPSDTDHDPAGVVRYLRRLLESHRGSQLRIIVTEIRAAMKRVGLPDCTSFPSLSRPDRESIIAALAEGNDARFRTCWVSFIEFCLEGYLCDPVRGGNLGQAGWRQVGMSGPVMPEIDG